MKPHLEILGARQQRALHQIGPIASKSGFYLAGGTALALQLGHRRSVDLDWFAPDLDNPQELAEHLKAQVPLEIQQIVDGTLRGRVFGVEVSFLRYPYRQLRPLVPCRSLGCRLASTADLAAMKVSAVSQRSAKKDFVDIWALLRKDHPVKQMLTWYRKKHQVEDICHALCSLVYFEDVEKQPMPKKFWPASWKSIKEAIREAVAKVK